MRIGLLRHGRTEWNRLGLLQGQTDIPLEDDERTRLATFALPDPWAGATLVSSTLSRASETAQLISGQQPRTDARLIEMAFGDWEGKAGLDLQRDPTSGFEDIEKRSWDYRAPNGESAREVWQRLEPALNALTEDTLIVCHMMVMRVILAKAYDWAFQGHPPFQIKRDRIYALARDGEALIADPEPVRLVTRCE